MNSPWPSQIERVVVVVVVVIIIIIIIIIERSRFSGGWSENATSLAIFLRFFPPTPRFQPYLANPFLIKLVRISGFSSLFSAIAVFLALSGRMC